MDLKPGAVISTTQDVDTEVPPLLRHLLKSAQIELVISGGRAVPLLMAPASQEPGCVLTDRMLDLKGTGSFKLPKGSEFLVKSVAAGKTASAVLSGPGTIVEVEAAPSVGMSLRGHFSCYPGKSSKKPISLEAFEEVFGRKIRVNLEKSPTAGAHAHGSS